MAPSRRELSLFDDCAPLLVAPDSDEVGQDVRFLFAGATVTNAHAPP